MKQLLLSAGALLFLSFTVHAEDWSGRLIDAACHDQPVDPTPVENQDNITKPACDATVKTTAFALDVNGKVYKFDPPGNVKAATALKYRPAPADGTRPSAAIPAKVTGTEAGGMILVDTIVLP